MVTVASPGYSFAVWLVTGTTTTRLRTAFAALLLTITAGRVFRISLPREGSNEAHHPVSCFAFAIEILCHLPIPCSETMRRILGCLTCCMLDACCCVIVDD